MPLSNDALRFELLRGLQSLPRAIVRDLAGKPEAREKALAAAALILLGRFEGCQVMRDERKALDFADMEKGAASTASQAPTCSARLEPSATGHSPLQRT
jgi:hypothetical protein